MMRRRTDKNAGTIRTGRPLRACAVSHAREQVGCGSVAFARCGFELFAVYDLHVATVIRDQPGLLQRARDDGFECRTCGEFISPSGSPGEDSSSPVRCRERRRSNGQTLGDLQLFAKSSNRIPQFLKGGLQITRTSLQVSDMPSDGTQWPFQQPVTFCRVGNERIGGT